MCASAALAACRWPSSRRGRTRRTCLVRRRRSTFRPATMRTSGPGACRRTGRDGAGRRRWPGRSRFASRCRPRCRRSCGTAACPVRRPLRSVAGVCVERRDSLRRPAVRGHDVDPPPRPRRERREPVVRGQAAAIGRPRRARKVALPVVDAGDGPLPPVREVHLNQLRALDLVAVADLAYPPGRTGHHDAVAVRMPRDVRAVADRLRACRSP